VELGRDFVVVLQYQLAELSAAKEGPMELICLVLEWLGFAWDLVIGTAQVADACRDIRDRSNGDLWN
jgi:hypothetical protein